MMYSFQRLYVCRPPVAAGKLIQPGPLSAPGEEEKSLVSSKDN